MDPSWIFWTLELLALGLVAFFLWRARQAKRLARQSQCELKQAEAEMNLQRSALDFSSFLQNWGQTHEQILKLIQETEIDRFLILRAWNGKLKPRWTTAVFQMRETGQEVVQYVHVELDEDYANRLQQMQRDGVHWFVVDNIADCGIKSIYESEGVTASLWAHIETREEGETAAITFCSMATHAEGGLSERTVTKCRMLAGRLKGVAGLFGDSDASDASGAMNGASMAVED